jgi:hypothetical protein
LAHRLSLPPDMTSDAQTWILPRGLTRVLPGALGALGGFLLGFMVSNYSCSDATYNCYPTNWLVVGLVAVAGLVVGLLASRIRRSMTHVQKNLMTAAVLILLLVLALACINRANRWSCPDGAFCQAPNADGSFTAT